MALKIKNQSFKRLANLLLVFLVLFLIIRTGFLVGSSGADGVVPSATGSFNIIQTPLGTNTSISLMVYLPGSGNVSAINVTAPVSFDGEDMWVKDVNTFNGTWTNGSGNTTLRGTNSSGNRFVNITLSPFFNSTSSDDKIEINFTAVSGSVPANETFLIQLFNGTRANSGPITVTTASGGNLWIKVIDNDKPQIVDTTSRGPTTGDSFTINASVTDNVGVSSVHLYYWFETTTGNTIAQNFTMNDIGAGNYDYTIISVPSNALVLHYNISANDTSNNWNETGDLTKSVIDNDLPMITDATFGNPTTGESFTLYATVTDNIGLQGAWFNQTMVSVYGYCHTWHSFVNNAGDVHSFNITVAVWNNATWLNYTIWAQDASREYNYSVRNLSVTDNGVPRIVDTTSGSPTTGDSYVISARVDDNINISSVRLYYWFETTTGNTVAQNSAMTNISDGNYNHTILIPSNALTLHYNISANDTSDNWQEGSDVTKSIFDNDGPEIVDTSPWFPTIDESFTINATVTDNTAEVFSVHLYYWFETTTENTTAQNYTMAAPDGVNYSHTLFIPLNAHVLHYKISAYDSHGNCNTSGELNRGVQLSTPQNLKAISGNGYVNITWDPPANGGSGVTYSILRTTVYYSPFQLNQQHVPPSEEFDSPPPPTTPIVTNVTWYNDTSVTNGETYYYWVLAVNDAGASPFSESVNVTLKNWVDISIGTNLLLSYDGNGSVSTGWVEAPNATIPENMSSVNLFFKIQVNGSVDNITLEISYDTSALSDLEKNQLRLYKLDNGTWEEVGSISTRLNIAASNGTYGLFTTKNASSMNSGSQPSLLSSISFSAIFGIITGLLLISFGLKENKDSTFWMGIVILLPSIFSPVLSLSTYVLILLVMSASGVGFFGGLLRKDGGTWPALALFIYSSLVGADIYWDNPNLLVCSLVILGVIISLLLIYFGLENEEGVATGMGLIILLLSVSFSFLFLSLPAYVWILAVMSASGVGFFGSELSDDNDLGIFAGILIFISSAIVGAIMYWGNPNLLGVSLVILGIITGLLLTFFGVGDDSIPGVLMGIILLSLSFSSIFLSLPAYIWILAVMFASGVGFFGGLFSTDYDVNVIFWGAIVFIVSATGGGVMYWGNPNLFVVSLSIILLSIMVSGFVLFARKIKGCFFSYLTEIRPLLKNYEESLDVSYKTKLLAKSEGACKRVVNSRILEIENEYARRNE